MKAKLGDISFLKSDHGLLIHKGSFNNYIDRILSFFDHPPTTHIQKKTFWIHLHYIYLLHVNI